MKGHLCLLIALLAIWTSCKERSKPPKALIDHIEPPVVGHAALPYLFSDGKNVLMSWVAPFGDSLSVLQYASFQNGKWGETQNMVSGSDWFVNWADFPSITENNGHLLSHVLKKSSGGTYSYDVKLNIRESGKPQWETDLSLHTDNTPTEHGFVTALPYKDHFFITWLDGRNTVENADGQRGAMTIRAGEVAVDGSVTNVSELDARTCDCCQTTAAITDNGPVVIYRDRSDEEIRDISIVRKVAGEWSVPKSIFRDGWKIKGCPVNGPKAVALGNHLAIAWFTAAEDRPLVNLVFSEDGGATFDKPIRIDEANAMGRVDVVFLHKDSAVVSWMESFEGRAVIKAMRADRDGIKGRPHIIAELDASRKTGFPQMELAGDDLLFAWTQLSGENTELRTALVAKAGF